MDAFGKASGPASLQGGVRVPPLRESSDEPWPATRQELRRHRRLVTAAASRFASTVAAAPKTFASGVSYAFVNDGETSFPTISAEVQVPKQIRSPPEPSSSVPISVSHFADADAEREMQAKAKRLAQFHAELSQQPVESPSDFSMKTLESKNSQIQPNFGKFPVGDSTKCSGDAFDGGLLSDYEGLESYPAICGLRPDMCLGILFSAFIV